MLEMLAELTPVESACLKDPDFITEDEADVIVARRRLIERGRMVTLEELLAEARVPRRRNPGVNGWQVELAPGALREYRLLNDLARRDTLGMLQNLADKGSVQVQEEATKLENMPDIRRARFRLFRIVYEVSGTRKNIRVLRLRRRLAVYIGLKKPGKKNPSRARRMTKAESRRGPVCQGSGTCGDPTKFVLETANYDPRTLAAMPGSTKVYLCGVHARTYPALRR